MAATLTILWRIWYSMTMTMIQTHFLGVAMELVRVRQGYLTNEGPDSKPCKCVYMNWEYVPWAGYGGPPGLDRDYHSPSTGPEPKSLSCVCKLNPKSYVVCAYCILHTVRPEHTPVQFVL